MDYFAKRVPFVAPTKLRFDIISIRRWTPVGPYPLELSPLSDAKSDSILRFYLLRIVLELSE